ncbi:MAG: peptidylprolyl isomerase [Candidatus Eremiobacteraeota bacterium]|nr:peptidylprolyl isomerase [Candidatus Eremiobacteraeota bacterium]
MSAVSPNPYVEVERLEQARSLGSGQLAADLRSAHRALALRAALAIGRTKLAAGIPLLRTRLHDPDPALRAMSVYGLGLIGTSYVQGDVLTALVDRSQAVRLAAFDAANRLETAKQFSKVNEASALRVLSYNLLRDRQALIRARAATAIEAFKDTAVAPEAARDLSQAFKTERDPNVRWHIMWTMFRSYASREPRSQLLGALRDSSELVRIEAVRALGRLKDPALVAHLEPLTRDPSWRAQEQALESIRALRKEPATEHLKALPPGLHLPPMQTDRFAHLPAIAFPAPAGTPGPPSASNVIVAATQGPHPRLRIVTTKGNLYVELYPEWAPLTVENFMNLASRGYYDNNPWFRIVPDFVVQTGGGVDGNSDVKYTIGAEENPLEQSSYVLSMGLNYTNPPDAHAIRDSAGSEWYITLSPQLHLNRDFTVFGRMIGGTDVLARLIESDKIVRIERLSDAPTH